MKHNNIALYILRAGQLWHMWLYNSLMHKGKKQYRLFQVIVLRLFLAHPTS